MIARLAFLLKTYALTVLTFITAKAGFMLYNQSGHEFSVGDMADVIVHGWSLDLSTALYFLIVPFFVAALSSWWQTKVWYAILKAYFLVVSIAFALAFVADAALYPFWGFKLDASCLQYLDSPTEAAASVSAGFIAVAVFAILAVAAVIATLFFLVLRQWEHGESGKRNTASQWWKALLQLLCIPLFVIGIRGGLRESTTNIGQVFFSQNQFLNHSAVNPVFSFLYSLSHTMGNTEQYQFMDSEECQRLTADVYTTESLDSDTLLTTTRPNVVIILLESCGEEFASAMPYLQQLKQEGIWFANCYGNSWRTDRGTVCTLSGYPSFPSLSVMKMPQKSNTLPSIARTLQQEDYHTSYLYGGDINFTNMRSYLVATGWERLVSMDDFTAHEQSSARWGVRDDITFKTLEDDIKGADKGTRWLWGYSTLSSHEPWDVPVKTLDDDHLNAFAYLDSCLKDFVESLRKSSAWDNLLIVMLADHGINYRDIDQSKPLVKNHIPMIWVGGAVKEPRRIETLCNQTDLAATLLGQLRLRHDEFTFSRDVLSRTYQHPTAVHNYNNAQLLIDSTGHVVYDFDAAQPTISNSTDAKRLLQLNKAILQVTTNDLKSR